MKQTIRKIIIAAAVLFAAGFTLSANAQVGVATPAMAEVWTKPGFVGRGGTTSIDFDMTIPEIYNMHNSETNYLSALQGNVILLDFGGTHSGIMCPSVGLCYTNASDMTLFVEAGNSIELGAFDDERNVPAPPTVRIYTTNPGGELAFAQYSGTVGVAESGEFYLDDNWEETDIATARGFVPVVCATNYERQSDMTSCELIPPVDAVCGANADNDPNDRTMCVCESNHQFVSGSTTECEAISATTELQTQTPESNSDRNAALGLGGAVIVGAIAFFYSGGTIPVFNFTPDFGYRITESGYSANAGGRADFHKDNWHLYYSGGQTNTDGKFGDFRYTSGGKYTADIWAATFSESVSGETADYDFSLSANLTGGIWKISPIYRLHSEYEKGETETQNTLNLEGVLRYNGWQIRPSAGFRWENADNFADNARFQINAIHRF